jgi:hypothetical protein
MSQAFACDWPDGGKQCGKPAEWYLAGTLTDRPICTACLAKVTPQPANHYSIEHIDPKRVPGPSFAMPIGAPDPWAATRIPFQSVGDGRAHNSPASGPQTVHTSGFISPERPSNPPAQPSGFGAMPPVAPSRPPLKDAFADLASALLDLGLTKVAEWRKR